MRGVTGTLNNESFVKFEICLPEINHIDNSNKFVLVRGSKTNEKGACLRFTDTTQDKAEIRFQTLVDNITVHITEVKTYPLTKIYVKLPNPDTLEVSEMFLEGYLRIDKVNLVSKKRTIEGDTLHKKMVDQKKLSIDSKIFIDIIGPPLVHESEQETDYGTIRRVKNSIDVEI